MKENNLRKKQELITNLKRKVKGITLIALVVTIIVLLILAAVAINLTIGNNGIFTRAQDSIKKWQEASKNEQGEMDKATDFLDKYLNKKGGTPSDIADAIEKGTFFEEKDTPLKDDLDNVVTIPKGFKVSEDSATKVEDGVVIEDHDGNQFVWIPAKTGEGTVVHTTLGDRTIVYKRTAFAGENIESQFSENLASEEKKSVNDYGGYYIGRYEAGDRESTDAKTMRERGTNTTNTVTIKRGQAPYNYITYDEQKKLAEEMKEIYGYEVRTETCSGFAWDTALVFMQIKNENYTSNSKEGNYVDTSFEYTDITGKRQTKELNSTILVPTGQTTPVCNIYDIGGNCSEQTSELIADYHLEPAVTERGGNYRKFLFI